MASMRVHELAKEFDMTSKELLDKLHEMKIPAKSHASMLADAYVAKIRKNLEPEIKQRAGQLEDEEARKLAEERAEAEAKKAEEERARREAVEQERAAREAERARREAAEAEASEAGQAPAADKPAKAPAPSPFENLASQIESEKERVAREAAEARARARQAKAMAEVAKKQAVEEALRQRNAKKQKGSSSASAPKPAPVIGAKKASGFDSLLSQIEAEKQRIEAQKKQGGAAPAGGAKDAARKGGKPERGPKKSKRGSFEQIVPELEAQQQPSGEDRYAQMAVQAEKLQRDKVLAEARAAVAAATSHEGEGRRKKRKEKREAENRERLEMEAIEKGLDPTLVLDDSVVEIPQGATVAKFAELLGVQPNDIIKRLFMLGQVLTLTQSMGDDLVELIADDMGRKVRVVSPEEEYAVVYHDKDEDLMPRPPVVTVMGHVDHGKTSLLDAIRDTGVVASEAGGITQHIGASVVEIDGKQITFIDTPGHEAFTAMRARGALITDVIVLVVAADDGVMPQTIEAINHAKAANVPIVVAVNKIDKPGANPDRVRQELTEYGVIPEEWGGSNMFVEVSAKQRLHIDDVLETIILQADVLELKANPNAEASGFVIEANLDKGRGPVATVLVQRGTLRPGDIVVAGTSYGRVRALVDPRGKHVDAALPADPVEILGLNSVPTAGDEFRVFEDERDARKLAEERALRARLAEQETKSHVSLDDLFSRIEEGKQTDLNLIVKADVQGSIEALRDAFEKMDQSEVRINIVHSAVGGITETDVTLASASDAIIIGFNVRPTGKSKVQAEKEKVDIRLYRVIYQAIEEINAARVGLLSPDIVEEDTGIAEVRETFKVPKVGTIAGCYITEGEIHRDDKVRIVRDGTVIFEGVMASLRRFKDDVKSVKQGYECGIGIEKFQDLKVGDTIEGYQVKEVERTE
ncbi:translation initiation factor IF-2 [Gordonibacter massiliensis (ex Traore et al. 2017)]|uniref:Translation initiation factor IF-2 n=1 Tax=Gordonibacter massiliensis (ex Traore et al. 2017) TaxID=1841863 RepID=A0A842JJF0_9ACTN|nr:translation initiation factor IF-2 [Gordonibacter massiliensis (ex Traore et al. 2017)]MBC2889230.1 translation initiation factor IF-2 [Gordonibacter massiliensis (ex Traore et al. 2017)]